MKSCLVFGNGASLKDFDFTKIDREKYDWVGCGMAFRHWNVINTYPDFYVNVDNVVCLNPDVIQFVKEKKCKQYLLSRAILEKIELDNREDIVFLEDLLQAGVGVFKYIRNWCSGSASVIFAMAIYRDIHIAGFDCDYVEFIPECIKLKDGTLKIKETPKHNPNYFFNDYQRAGDIYNVPNGKKIHLTSWKELSYIIDFCNKMYPEHSFDITNYNNKVSISEFIKTKSLSLFLNPNKNKNRVAFCVPTTSRNTGWSKLEESHLHTILFQSIKNLTKTYDIELYIGYDDDDELYTKISLPKTYEDLKLNWISFSGCRGNPCKIWTGLTKRAIDDGIEYIQIGGDDIYYDKRTDWLGKFIKLLKKNNNIGYSAGFSNNERIPTQFLIHKKHYEIFNWVYPPQIHNWFCDDWLAGVYGTQYGNWLKEYKHLNVGGDPRYKPKNDKKLCDVLIDRHKKTLKNFV